MDKLAVQNNVNQMLYPPIHPYDTRVLEVGDGHEVYVEQCGNPDGLPVVVLHGGPGGGCSPYMRRFFDPKIYRIVLFDQRGCGRSVPHASVEANTTWHLIDDIEQIRQTFGIDQWIVFGGSWGATLALAYAQSHPERALHLVLRGVFSGRKRELDWFYGGGPAQFWPEKWAAFVEPIPHEERDDVIKAYARRLFCGDEEIEQRYGLHWAKYEGGLASMNAAISGEGSPRFARCFARLENHYFQNQCFFGPETDIHANMEKIAHISGTIIQGRYDLICPPITAQEIHQAWPASKLIMVANAGHMMSEPAITQNLIDTMDGLRALAP